MGKGGSQNRRSEQRSRATPSGFFRSQDVEHVIMGLRSGSVSSLFVARFASEQLYCALLTMLYLVHTSLVIPLIQPRFRGAMSSHQTASRLEVVGQLRDPGPVLGPQGPAGLDHPLQLFRAGQLRMELALDVASLDLSPGHRIGAVEREMSHENLEDQRTEGKHVVRRVDRTLWMLQELGTGVDKVGQSDGVVEQAELHFGLEEHVARAQPAVNNALGMEVAQRVGHLAGDGHLLGHEHPTQLRRLGVQRLRPDWVRHDGVGLEVVPLVEGARSHEGDDVLVANLHESLHFVVVRLRRLLVALRKREGVNDHVAVPLASVHPMAAPVHQLLAEVQLLVIDAPFAVEEPVVLALHFAILNHLVEHVLVAVKVSIVCHTPNANYALLIRLTRPSFYLWKNRDVNPPFDQEAMVRITLIACLTSARNRTLLVMMLRRNQILLDVPPKCF